MKEQKMSRLIMAVICILFSINTLAGGVIL